MLRTCHPLPELSTQTSHPARPQTLPDLHRRRAESARSSITIALRLTNEAECVRIEQENPMIRKVCVASATALILASGAQMLPSVTLSPAAAQGGAPVQNLIPESEAVTLHAKITAIDPNSRSVTLKSPSGQQVTVTAGPVVRLDMLKVGDTVNVKYYRSVAFAVAPPTPGNAAPRSDNELEAVLAQPPQAPGGIGVAVLKITGTVVGISMASHTVDL